MLQKVVTKTKKLITFQFLGHYTTNVFSICLEQNAFMFLLVIFFNLKQLNIFL